MDHTSCETPASLDPISHQTTPSLDSASHHPGSSIASPLTTLMDIDNISPHHISSEDDDDNDASSLTTPMDIDNGTSGYTTSPEDNDDASHPTTSLTPQPRTSPLVNRDHLSSVQKRISKSIHKHRSKRRKSRAKQTIFQPKPDLVFSHGSKQYPIWVDIDGDVSVVFIITLHFLIFCFLFQPMLDHDLLDLPVPVVCYIHLSCSFLCLKQSQLSEDRVTLSMWHTDANRPKREYVFQAPHTVVS